MLKGRKWVWRLFHNNAPDARAMFILGVQRSGTTILGRCLNKCLELEVYGETSKAMKKWRLRSPDTIKSIIKTSRSKAVVFKPLTESHRALELMTFSPDSIVCWMYRRPADRANSAVAKFGSTNLKVLAAFARGEGLQTWQAQGLSQENLELVRSFDYEKMSRHDAAGLFWYIRNSLFFDQNLVHLENVVPLAYEDLVKDPEKVMAGLCRILGCRFSVSMSRAIHANSVGRSPSKLGDEVDKLCQPLYVKLHQVQQRRWQELGL
jgi:Sulfotransferase domain